MKAEIITIGDEILRGEIIDSNKALLAERLLDLDIECHQQVSVRDEPSDLRDAFLRAASRSEVILVSGGLGPTRDDITSEVIGKSFGLELLLDEASLAAMRAFFERIGREMSETNRKQAFFPLGAEVLPNPIGTASGFALDLPASGVGSKTDAIFFCMPGVPRELVRMLDEEVLPRLRRRLGAAGRAPRVVRARLLRTFGMGESSLEAELSDIARGGDVELGFRTTFPDNYLRVVARAASAEQADRRIEEVVEAIRKRLGALVYAEGDQTLAAIVQRLLVEHGETLAVAESCTGGGIARRLTDVPGASRCFLGGVVAYANSAKQSQLGVPAELLESHGAVSEPVVRAMAEGVKERFGATIGVATSGISGPRGGTPEKPVGTLQLALARERGTHSDCFVFPVDRARHRQLSAQLALDWVRRTLLGIELIGPSLLSRRGGGPPPGAPHA